MYKNIQEKCEKEQFKTIELKTEETFIFKNTYEQWRK
jgi:hypothetical protein